MTHYPFLYYGHGTSYYKDEYHCLIWFQRGIGAGQLDNFQKLPLFDSGIPFDIQPVNESMILISIPKHYEYEVKAHYNAEFRKKIASNPEETDVWGDDKRFLPDSTEWRKFDEEFDAILAELHRTCSIWFVVKAATPGKKFGFFSPWHDWSLEYFHEKAWPAVDAFLLGEQKNRIKPELVEKVNGLINVAVSSYLKKYKYKKDLKKSNLEMIDSLCMQHIVYHDEEYNLEFKWLEYEEHVFANAAVLGKLLPKDERAVDMIKGLGAYTQLVCFSGCDYPYLLLFENPGGYLKDLLGKIDGEKVDVLHEYLNLVGNQIYDWFREGNAPMDRKLINEIHALILDCDPIGVLTYRNILDRWQIFGEWEKVLAQMKNRKYVDYYLLHYEKPVDYLKDFAKQFPRKLESARKVALTELAGIVKKTKVDEKKHGWKHNMVDVSQGIIGIIPK